MLLYDGLSNKYEESTLFEATLWWPIYAAEYKNMNNSPLLDATLWWPIYAAEYKNIIYKSSTTFVKQLFFLKRIL